MDRRAPTYRLNEDSDRRLDELVDRVLADGFRALAEEFEGLEEYIARARENSDGEHSLRRTPREKYLLEAIAYKIYDRLNRDEFNRTEETLIVLPDCLSLHNPDCLKTDESTGDRCMQCVDECQASQVIELADEYGAEVVFSKRKLGAQLEHYRDRSKNVGVIGIGCMIMLAEGMRTAADAGVPSRGVLLSYCGCEHWNDEPFASAFPMRQLRAILEEKYGQADSTTDD